MLSCHSRFTSLIVHVLLLWHALLSNEFQHTYIHRGIHIVCSNEAIIHTGCDAHYSYASLGRQQSHMYIMQKKKYSKRSNIILSVNWSVDSISRQSSLSDDIHVCAVIYVLLAATKWVHQPSVVSLDNIFISWTWLSENLCCRPGGTWRIDSIVCWIGFHLNFSFLQFVWRH